MPHFFRVFLPFFYDAYVVWPLNLVCRYSTHRLKCKNYGLSNAHTFVDTALSSGHIGVISTRTCISEPKLFLETIFITTWRGYFEQVCIPVIPKKLMLRLNPQVPYMRNCSVLSYCDFISTVITYLWSVQFRADVFSCRHNVIEISNTFALFVSVCTFWSFISSSL